MIKKLVFSIPGIPVPKGRPRMTRTGHVYTPGKTRRYENHVRSVCMQFKSEPELIDCIVLLFLTFHMKRPIDHKNKIYPETKPDLDNLIKSVIDGMNGVMFYDDKMVVDIKAKKVYCELNQERVDVDIEYHRQ